MDEPINPKPLSKKVTKTETFKDPEMKERYLQRLSWIKSTGCGTIIDFARSIDADYITVYRWMCGRIPKRAWRNIIKAKYGDSCPFLHVTKWIEYEKRNKAH